MRKHKELRALLDKLNGMEIGKAAGIVTEVLKYLMDKVQSELERESRFNCEKCGTEKCVRIDTTIYDGKVRRTCQRGCGLL